MRPLFSQTIVHVINRLVIVSMELVDVRARDAACVPTKGVVVHPLEDIVAMYAALRPRCSSSVQYRVQRLLVCEPSSKPRSGQEILFATHQSHTTTERWSLPLRWKEGSHDELHQASHTSLVYFYGSLFFPPDIDFPNR